MEENNQMHQNEQNQQQKDVTDPNNNEVTINNQPVETGDRNMVLGEPEGEQRMDQEHQNNESRNTDQHDQDMNGREPEAEVEVAPLAPEHNPESQNQAVNEFQQPAAAIPHEEARPTQESTIQQQTEEKKTEEAQETKFNPEQTPSFENAEPVQKDEEMYGDHEAKVEQPIQQQENTRIPDHVHTAQAEPTQVAQPAEQNTQPNQVEQAVQPASQDITQNYTEARQESQVNPVQAQSAQQSSPQKQTFAAANDTPHVDTSSRFHNSGSPSITKALQQTRPSAAQMFHPTTTQSSYLPEAQNKQLLNLAKQFFEIVKTGDIGMVQEEVEKKNLDVTQLVDDLYKQTAVFFATLSPTDARALEMIRWLVQQGLAANQIDTLNQTALYYASREGKAQTIEYLVKQGCNVNHHDTFGQTPLFYAARDNKVDTALKLIEQGGNVDYRDNNGQTPIYYAIKYNQYDVVEILLAKGANPNSTDKKGITPMNFAKKNDRPRILEVLQKYGGKMVADKNSNSKSKASAPKQQQKRVENERLEKKTYVLTVLKNGLWEPITAEELSEFERNYPDFSKYLQDPQEINTIKYEAVPDSAPIYDAWEKSAKRLINSLWKHKNCWLFYQPVNPEFLGIPDYYQIITKPMDLGTVKTKLNANEYKKADDFISDIELTFNNCITYNGEKNNVTNMCKEVMREYEKLRQNLYFDFYLSQGQSH